MTWRTEWWKITVAEQNIQKRIQRNKDSLRDLWDNIKCTNVCMIGVPEGLGPEKIFKERIVENFLNMGKETVTQIQ